MLTQQLEEQQNQLYRVKGTLQSVIMEKERIEATFLISEDELKAEIKQYEEQIYILKEEVKSA